MICITLLNACKKEEPPAPSPSNSSTTPTSQVNPNNPNNPTQNVKYYFTYTINGIKDSMCVETYAQWGWVQDYTLYSDSCSDGQAEYSLSLKGRLFTIPPSDSSLVNLIVGKKFSFAMAKDISYGRYRWSEVMKSSVTLNINTGIYRSVNDVDTSTYYNKVNSCTYISSKNTYCEYNIKGEYKCRVYNTNNLNDTMLVSGNYSMKINVRKK